MPLVAWRDEFSVGVPEIDEQHRRLVEMLNQLNDAINSGKGNEAIADILLGMMEYTVYHFQYEEKLLGEFDYPEFAEHKKEHEALLKTARELKFKYLTGDPGVAPEALQFLREWLKKHILESDMKYSEFLVAHKVAA